MAVLIIGTLIALEAFCYFLIFRRLNPWNKGLEDETSSGSLITNSKNYGEILAILHAQPGKRRSVLWLALFLQIGSLALFAPQMWSILDLVPYIDNTGALTPPEGMIALALVCSFILYLIGLLPFIYVVTTRFSTEIVTTEGIARRSPWFRKKIFMTWGDIEEISMPHLVSSNTFLLESEREQIWINGLFVGLDVFAKTLMEKVPREKWIKVEGKLLQSLKGPFF